MLCYVIYRNYCDLFTYVFTISLKSVIFLYKIVKIIFIKLKFEKIENTGYKTIENKLEGWRVLYSAPVEGSDPAEHS